MLYSTQFCVPLCGLALSHASERLVPPSEPVVLFGKQGTKMMNSVFSDKEVICDFCDNSFTRAMELKAKL